MLVDFAKRLADFYAQGVEGYEAPRVLHSLRLWPEHAEAIAVNTDAGAFQIDIYPDGKVKMERFV